MDPSLIVAIVLFSLMFLFTAIVALRKRKVNNVEEMAQLNHKELLEHIKTIEVKIDKIAERNAKISVITEENRLQISELKR